EWRRQYLHRRQRHQHGGAACFGRHRRISVYPARIHRKAGRCEAAVPLDGDGPVAEPVLSGEGTRGSDEGDTGGVGMSSSILEIEFDKSARLVMPAQEQAIIQALTASNPTIARAIVLSHGWNNDMDEARTLYRDFLRQFEQVAPAAAASTAAIGILWPAKRFTD